MQLRISEPGSSRLRARKAATRSALVGPFLAGESSPFHCGSTATSSQSPSDLAAAGGLAAARALIERADVLIENLRPGAMDQLGPRL